MCQVAGTKPVYLQIYTDFCLPFFLKQSNHNRLGLENKFLESKSGWIFRIRQVCFTKSCKQIWVHVNQPFIHHIWGERVLQSAVVIIQNSDKIQFFTIFQDKLHSFNIQGHRSTRGLSRKSFKKVPELPIWPAGSHFWQVPNLQRALKELLINLTWV